VASLRDRGNVALHLAKLNAIRKHRTRHHQAAIYLHPELGNVLVLNGEIQHVEAWAPLYHEPLVHLAAAYTRSPKTALILGGGSFFAAKEVLKYASIKRVLMLDHDKEVCDLVSETYSHAAEVRQDVRLELHYEDAFQTLESTNDRFDLIVNDSVDLLRRDGAGAFGLLGARLSRGGVCSDVIYRHIFAGSHAAQSFRLLQQEYRIAASMIFVPEYPGVMHVLTLWGTGRFLVQTLRKPRNLEQQMWCRSPNRNPCLYYDPRFLSYYLHLPPYLRRQIKEKLD